MYSLSQIKDEFIGEPENPTRLDYENRMAIDLIGIYLQEAMEDSHIDKAALAEKLDIKIEKLSEAINSPREQNISFFINAFNAMGRQLSFTTHSLS
jgi:hypothetical protein